MKLRLQGRLFGTTMALQEGSVFSNSAYRPWADALGRLSCLAIADIRRSGRLTQGHNLQEITL